MPEHYRVRLRRGDHEVEVESSDKSYVDRKLDDLLPRVTGATSTPESRSGGEVSNQKRKASRKQRAKADGRTSRSDDELMGLVHYIQGHDEFNRLAETILSGRSQLPRILMCLYYGSEHFADPHLTTGELEAVTNQLGARIQKSNIAKVLKKHPTYITSDAMRKKGTIVGYKINRNGQDHFRGLLMNGES